MVTTTASPSLAGIGARPLPELDGVHDVWPRGERLRAVREAAAAYPVSYAFHDAVSAPTLPLISMIDRMIVVQHDDWDGRPRTLVLEPTVPDSGPVEKVVLKYDDEPGDVLGKRGRSGVDPDRFVTFASDLELGPGIALLWTPGHTDGNHSLVINTPDGVWVSSENGISLDNWQPELSKIPGVRRYHESPCQNDPRWLQILPSTELAPWKRFWPVVPTYVPGGLEYGSITAGLR